ncbi:MAG: tetratricopeptide repeat protein [Candidatus Melainabacteria bacterium]|nr:tetratricopeptide repeat protein [Candidatus Melainabacteria bacterium]
MSILLPIALLLVVFALYFVMTAPQRARANSNRQADHHLQRAGSLMLSGRLDEAESAYFSAMRAARASQTPIYEAEANSGLADVARRRGQLEQARTYLKAALALRPQFEEYFPNYAQMLERELAEVEAELNV